MLWSTSIWIFLFSIQDYSIPINTQMRRVLASSKVYLFSQRSICTFFVASRYEPYLMDPWWWHSQPSTQYSICYQLKHRLSSILQFDTNPLFGIGHAQVSHRCAYSYFLSKSTSSQSIAQLRRFLVSRLFQRVSTLFNGQSGLLP